MFVYSAGTRLSQSQRPSAERLQHTRPMGGAGLGRPPTYAVRLTCLRNTLFSRNARVPLT